MQEAIHDKGIPMTGLTRALARFASAPPFATVPEDVLPVVRNGFIDTCATLLAGRAEPVVQVLLRHLQGRVGRGGEAGVLLQPLRAGSVDAALINGTAAHALDYDDVALNGHPSTVLVPALLAEGEALGASGARLLRAYLVGYEVWAELIGRDSDPHHTKGWHPTAVFGTVGAAAAVACLHQLDTNTATHALAIAASMAGGLSANFGSMTKPYHAGRAASAGVEAVRLARLGMTGAVDAIEHHAGLLQALSPRGRVDRGDPAQPLGQALRIREAGLNIKKYPVCYAVHRVIDGVLDLAAAADLRADQVEGVVAQVGPTQAAMLRNHAPQTGLEAKFSLEFAMASALVARGVGLAQLTDDFVQRPEVQAAMTRVQARTVDTQCPIEPFLALTDRVTVRLKDGRTLDSGEIRFARGSAHLPLTSADLRAKFLDCARLGGEGDAEGLLSRLSALQQLGDVSQLQPVHR